MTTHRHSTGLPKGYQRKKNPVSRLASVRCTRIMIFTTRIRTLKANQVSLVQSIPYEKPKLM